MSMLTKILSAIVLALFLVSSLEAVRIYQLKAKAEHLEKEHAVALSKALEKQAADLSAQTIAEQKLRENRDRQIRQLLTQIKTMEDYHAKLAPALHAWIDGMLIRSTESTRLVPADSGGPP